MKCLADAVHLLNWDIPRSLGAFPITVRGQAVPNYLFLNKENYPQAVAESLHSFGMMIAHIFLHS